MQCQSRFECETSGSLRRKTVFPAPNEAIEPLQQAVHYRAFGLVIVSDQRITSLAQISAESPDVTIAVMPLDHSFDDDRLKTQFANWRAGPDCLLLRVDDVAEYCIRDGNRIEIKPVSSATDEAISAFLMSSAFATLLQQRHILTVHASGVLGPNGAILFVGPSGIGKSTTMAAMQGRGFEMVSDDVGAIEFRDDGLPLVRSSFAGGKLTERTLTKLGKSVSEYRKLDTEIEKFAYPIELNRSGNSPVDRIIVLGVDDRPDVTSKALSRTEAFQLMSYYTFRKRFYDGMGLQDFHFNAVSKLVSTVPVIRITRPEHPFLLSELVDLIVDQTRPSTDHQALT